MSTKYSQNNEQEVILAHFAGKAAGKLLDIGAFAAKDLSNTRALIEAGWSGVLVEPSPRPFIGLVEAYKDTPQVVLVNVAVTGGTEPEFKLWYDSGGDAISTTVDAHRALWAGNGVKFTQHWVYLMPVAALITAFGMDVDFISLDVEKTNFSVFSGIPFENLSQLRMICVEHDNQWQVMEARLQPLGFRLMHLNGENAIFGR